MYDSYYIPSAISGSKGRGIVLVGYGSYFGYLDTYTGGTEERMEEVPLVGASGHMARKSPLVSVSREEKNADFMHILSTIDREMKRIAAE